VADQAASAKAVGADLKEGKRTLPLIAALERATPCGVGSRPVRAQGPRREPGEIEEIRLLVER